MQKFSISVKEKIVKSKLLLCSNSSIVAENMCCADEDVSFSVKEKIRETNMSRICTVRATTLTRKKMLCTDVEISVSDKFVEVQLFSRRM